MNQINLRLPWPPSVNHYWRNVRGRTLISRDGRDYRATVEKLAAGLKASNCRLSVQITAHPPDRRRRDLDNLLKAPLDAMCHAGVYADDSQIDRLMVTRGEVMKDGRLYVQIWEVP